MSEYHKVDIDFQDEECLVKALEEIGWKAQVHKEAIQLEGYQGDKREQRAHIIIPRSIVGTASNDIGFERVSGGKYIAHVSEFDSIKWKKNESKIKQLYAKNIIVKQTKKTKFKIEKQVQEADGTIRIRMRVKH